MVKTQDQIIFETEMLTEQCRNELSVLKEKISNECFRECWTWLESALFDFTVLFYTHRFVWTQPEFWSNYARSANSKKFAETAYQRMIHSTLVNAYLILYFYIEGALNCYLIQTGRKRLDDRLGFLEMYNLLDKSIYNNELKNGLEILKYTRNSAHGDKGTFIFSLSTREKKSLETGIIKKSFKGEEYTFEEGKVIVVSYKFLRDFIPQICDLYKSLFLKDIETFTKCLTP